MKRYILTVLLAGALGQLTLQAQEQLAPDQNPQFRASRDKYMKGADSLNALHGTTVHRTYKAFDWYEAKMERRRERTQFRRELRTLRADRSYRYPDYRYDRRYRYNRSYYNNWWWF